MTDLIKGLHHVTSMAKDAVQTDLFFNQVLGLRRIKQTVNFDAPDVYHLYYGDGAGTPGSVMTYFPSPNIAAGRKGAGEVSTTVFSVPEGALSYWRNRLETADVTALEDQTVLGAARLGFDSPDGERFALLEVAGDERSPWTDAGVPADVAIRGFHSVELRLVETRETGELLAFLGYELQQSDAIRARYIAKSATCNQANTVDLVTAGTRDFARLGAGSVHHVAFAVETHTDHAAIRQLIADTGYQVTPIIDRDYFHAIYFRTPGGVLFEVATNEPGFARDEAPDQLGNALKLPNRHEHLRATLEASLTPLPPQAG